MKIGIAGGIGFEDRLVSIFKGFEILLVGSKYNLQNESFHTVKGVEFFPEFITHNYLETFRDSDIFINISISNKSGYLISDFSRHYGKKCYILFYDEGWKIAVLSTERAHLHLIKPYKRSLPFSVLPELKTDKIIDFFSREIENFSKKEDYLFNIEKEEKSPISFEKNDYSFDFLNGQICDIVSVSCSDNSVAISSMNDSAIDFKELKKHLSGKAILLRENQFFVEFKIEKYRFLVFRQGRIVVKGTKKKETALYVYYNFVGD